MRTDTTVMISTNADDDATLPATLPSATPRPTTSLVLRTATAIITG